jgi:hypothetical protein
MTWNHVPESFAIVTFDTGRAAFALSGRAWDEVGHDMFAIQLHNRPVLYGEWREKWAANRNDFEVEIMSFGYRDAFRAGSPNLSDRNIFTSRERTILEDLIRRLFLSSSATKNVPSFTSTKGRFLGGVHFSDGWILARTDTQ